MKKTLIVTAILVGAVSAYSQGTVAFQMVNGSVFGQQIFNVSTANNTTVTYDGVTVLEEQGSDSGGAVAPGSKENPTGSSVYSGAGLTGSGFSAQMLGAAGAGDALSTLLPLTSSTGTGILNFYTATAFVGFVSGSQTDPIPNTSSTVNTPSTIAIAAWVNSGGLGAATSLATAIADGYDWGISELETINAAGGSPPPTPTGLQAGEPDNLTFSLGVPIPEPSTIALGVMGVSALLFRRRK
jgi:hypothetical protein